MTKADRLSAKNTYAQSRQRLKILSFIGIAVSSAFLLILIRKWSSYGLWHKFISLLYFLINVGVLKYLHFLSEPSKNEQGKVVVAHSISDRHLLHDALYLSWFGQVVALFTRHSWLPLLFFPGLALYKVAGLIKAYVFTPTAEEMLTDEEKEKMKKKAQRAANRSRGHKSRR
ncbi:hypothetical protein GEMRC1_007549 [Eukaryota sp. GEM-RC1]